MSTRIETLNRKYVDPINMAVDDVDIKAIAHALSHQCRFNGYTSRHYSVAEHSYYVSLLVEAAGRAKGLDEGDLVDVALQALLHDATEAYLVDIPRPLKSALPEYKGIEARLWAVCAAKFQIKEARDPSVIEADMRICVTEKLALLSPDGLERPEWASLNRDYKAYTNGEITIPTAHIAPETARAWFLERYKDLTQRRYFINKDW